MAIITGMVQPNLAAKVAEGQLKARLAGLAAEMKVAETAVAAVAVAPVDTLL